MSERRPQPGELYRHFKNNMYQVTAIAKHSETGEELVIYQALYGDYGIYARPLSMFVSEVDHEKYPQITQKYRFELVGHVGAKSHSGQHISEVASQAGSEQHTSEVVSQTQSRQHTDEVAPQTADDSVEEKMLAFLDADTMEAKYKILLTMEEEINDHLINNMAVTLDVVIDEGDVKDRYDQLKRCVATMNKYESNRFR